VKDAELNFMWSLQLPIYFTNNFETTTEFVWFEGSCPLSSLSLHFHHFYRLGLFFCLEDGGSRFLEYINYLPDFMASHNRRLHVCI
jgi:hypothetical protein